MLSDKKEGLSILVHIGTSKISVSFSVFSKNKNPKILSSIKLPFSTNVKIGEVLLTQSMLSMLEELIIKLIKKGSTIAEVKSCGNIHSVYITISSPWYVSKMKDIHLIQDNQFIISETFIQNILNVEEKKFEEEIKNGQYEKIFGNKLSIIENTFTSNKVNGYWMKDIIGKKTNNFDISLYSSVISEDILEKILSIVHKHTHLSENKIHISTFPLMFFYIMKEINSNLKNYLIMDIMGEVTELTLVHNGGINQNISFPSARNFIIRQISKYFDVSFEIAESTLHLYNSGKADAGVVDKMNLVLSEVEKEWAIYFEDALSQFSKNVILPPVIYILSNDDVYPLYEAFLNIAKSSEISLFRKNLSMSRINKDIFSKYCNFDPLSEYDEYLAALVIFYDKIKISL